MRFTLNGQLNPSEDLGLNSPSIKWSHNTSFLPPFYCPIYINYKFSCADSQSVMVWKSKHKNARILAGARVLLLINCGGSGFCGRDI